MQDPVYVAAQNLSLVASRLPRNRPIVPKKQRDCSKLTSLAKKYEKQRFRVDAFWQKPYRPARHSTAPHQFAKT
jgi:hypothetical protein